MKCPSCQHENRPDATFCDESGIKLELVCTQCGKANRPTAKFCDGCGQDFRKPKEAEPIDYNEPQSYTPKFLADKILTSRSSIEGERKIVTVLSERRASGPYGLYGGSVGIPGKNIIFGK